MNQKGFAPILIVIIIAALVGTYYLSKAYTERLLTYAEAESFIINCNVYSVGQSHQDIEKGYLTMTVKDTTGKNYTVKVDKTNQSQIDKKIDEVTSSGKCPKIIHWIE